MGRCSAIFEDKNNQNTAVLAIAFSQVFLMACLNMWSWWKIRKARAKMAETQWQQEPTENSFLLPIYSKLMWATCVGLLIDAVLHVIAPFSIENPNTLTASIINGVAYLVKQFCFDVTALAMMSPSSGRRSIIRASLVTGVWALITFGLKFGYTFTVGEYPRFSTMLDLIWLAVLMAFYYTIWLFPSLDMLFRRPAVRVYAAYWAILYTLFALSAILRYFRVDGGYCLYIADSALLWTLCPWAVFKACNDDSLYWQGAMLLAQDDKAISTVVADNPMSQDVAVNIAQADSSGVKVINFVALSIDQNVGQSSANTNANSLLGQGTYARVYRGRYKDRPVAIKLIYAPELTKEIVDNLIREATTLGSLKSTNVVGVEGVCVMPPALALVMELCNGSLFSYLHGSDTGVALSLKEQVRLARDCCAAIDFLHSRKHPIVHLDIKSGNFLMGMDGHVKVADLELSTRLLVTESSNRRNSQGVKGGALVASPTLSLHTSPTASPGAVGSSTGSSGSRVSTPARDIETGSPQGGIPASPTLSSLSLAKSSVTGSPASPGGVGDVEGGTTGAAEAGSSVSKDAVHQTMPPETCYERCCGTSSATQTPQKLIVPEAVNWLAPEIMRDEPFGTPADVYSLACVMWEIISRKVPYEELATELRAQNQQIVNSLRRMDTFRDGPPTRNPFGPATRNPASGPSTRNVFGPATRNSAGSVSRNADHNNAGGGAGGGAAAMMSGPPTRNIVMSTSGPATRPVGWHASTTTNTTTTTATTTTTMSSTTGAGAGGAHHEATPVVPGAFDEHKSEQPATRSTVNDGSSSVASGGAMTMATESVVDPNLDGPPVPLMRPRSVSATMKERIAWHGYRPPIPSHSNPELVDIITQAWNSDPMMRPTAREMLKRLQSLYDSLPDTPNGTEQKECMLAVEPMPSSISDFTPGIRRSSTGASGSAGALQNSASSSVLAASASMTAGSANTTAVQVAAAPSSLPSHTSVTASSLSSALGGGSMQAIAMAPLPSRTPNGSAAGGGGGGGSSSSNGSYLMQPSTSFGTGLPIQRASSTSSLPGDSNNATASGASGAAGATGAAAHANVSGHALRPSNSFSVSVTGYTETQPSGSPTPTAPLAPASTTTSTTSTPTLSTPPPPPPFYINVPGAVSSPSISVTVPALSPSSQPGSKGSSSSSSSSSAATHFTPRPPSSPARLPSAALPTPPMSSPTTSITSSSSSSSLAPPPPPPFQPQQQSPFLPVAPVSSPPPVPDLPPDSDEEN